MKIGFFLLISAGGDGINYNPALEEV